jgi:hypothetical protein
MFCPTNGELFVGTAQRPSGKTYKRFLGKDGFLLYPDQVAVNSDRFVLNIPTLDGATVAVTIKLPFERLEEVSGATKRIPIDRLEKRIELQRREIEEYLQRLLATPSIDPDFAAALSGLNCDLMGLGPPEISVRGTSTTSEVEAITDASDVDVGAPTEALAMLLGKIAWTHACKALGPTVIHDGAGAELFLCLCSTHVLIDDEAGLLGEKQKIVSRLDANVPDGDTSRRETFYVWSADSKRASDEVAQAGWPDHIRIQFEAELLRRRGVFLELSRFVWVDSIPETTQAEVIKAPRWHELQFLVGAEAPNGGTAVAVRLFGGVVSGRVTVSRQELAVPREPKRITCS